MDAVFWTFVLLIFDDVWHAEVCLVIGQSSSILLISWILYRMAKFNICFRTCRFSNEVGKKIIAGWKCFLDIRAVQRNDNYCGANQEPSFRINWFRRQMRNMNSMIEIDVPWEFGERALWLGIQTESIELIWEPRWMTRFLIAHLTFQTTISTSLSLKHSTDCTSVFLSDSINSLSCSS